MLAAPGAEIDLPDLGPVFLTALGIHALAGITAVVSAIVATTSRKRPGRHPVAGRVYLGALAVLAASAVTMAVLRGREDAHLFVVALVAAGLGFLGWQARRRRRTGWRLWHGIGMGGSFIAVLTGIIQ